MAERVHPSLSDKDSMASPMSSSEHPLKPAAGTYVIQIPKDTVYRVPPPENAHRFERYTRKKAARRSGARRCVCASMALLTLVCAIAAVSAAVMYLVYRPESPRFSLDSLSIRGLSSQHISPAIALTLTIRNPNDKLQMLYGGTRSSVKVFYSDVELCHGVMPPFRQAANNVTVIKTALKGPGEIELTAAVNKEMRQGEKKGKVPLKLTIRIPVKVKVGSVNTWTLAFRVTCPFTVNNLTPDANIVSTDCHHSWNLWW